MLVGFATVVGLRLLDWAFPRGYISRKVATWSVKQDPEDEEGTP